MARPASVLTGPEEGFVARARRATLATVDPDGNPRLVPVCFVLGSDPKPGGRPRLYSPLDDKPKQAPNLLDLARVRDLLARPRVSLLVDRWDEGWSLLGWVRLRGEGSILDPGDAEPDDLREHAVAVAALREKYPQYLEHDLERRPLIRIELDRASSWGNLEPA